MSRVVKNIKHSFTYKGRLDLKQYLKEGVFMPFLFVLIGYLFPNVIKDFHLPPQTELLTTLFYILAASVILSSAIRRYRDIKASKEELEK